MKHCTLSLLLLFSIILKSQNIDVASRSLNLGNAFENSAASGQVTVYNPGIFPIEVEDIDLFQTYGNFPFSLSDTAFTIMPQDSQTITVSFLPEHNIMHNSALVLKTKSGFGHVAVQLNGQGKYSNTYYNSTENKEEEALKSALKTRLGQGYNSLGYTAARDNMYATIDNTGGTVECVYTGRTANFTTRAGANSNNFNCEHTFPQGFFNQNEPMRSDIHHLFPTDVSANSRRSNDPFGIVSNPSWQQGGSKSGGGKFEPRNIHKGACARAMMYFVIRYQDYSNHFSGQESILRSWHNTYAPSNGEKVRNNQIAALQTSRNPFVDYPQFEERINNFVSNSTAPVRRDFYYSDDTIELRQAAGRYEYELVFFNNGNQVVNLTNFNLSDTSLHFVPNAPLSLAVQPGTVENLVISFQSSNSYLATLTFDTDIPGQSSKVIPINSTVGIGVEEEVTQVPIRFYPNPATDELRFGPGNISPSEVRIYDISGRERMYAEEVHVLDISTLESGLYFVRLTTEQSEVVMHKMLKK